jgi:hypothetical protein
VRPGTAHWAAATAATNARPSSKTTCDKGNQRRQVETTRETISVKTEEQDKI